MEWYKCSNALPKNEEDVLIYDCEILIGYYSDSLGGWPDPRQELGDYAPRMIEPTHWMPLPQAPQS